MLSEKKIRQILREEITAALTVKVRYEQVRDPETGQPLATPKIEVRDIYLPAHWVEMLPYLEGAIRGMQETTDKAVNRTIESHEAIRAMAELMIGAEENIKALAQASMIIHAIDPKGFEKALSALSPKDLALTGNKEAS